ncbi:MAG: D-tyrosyl-tRNA(Tyr) deacylase [Actinomycetia bacterium]|nr:D-tyrosyl-tRNA(Tyr) deacylase [Actinomycetes bacterium]
MKALIQRVKKANVYIENKLHSSIKKGLLIFLGVEESDEEKDIEYLVKKTSNLRIFENEDNKFDFSLKDVNGEVMVVSQFTLAGDCRKGNRPNFNKAAKPGKALKYYESFINKLNEEKITVEKGIFGAKMEVELINDGPVTIILDSKKKRNTYDN